VAVAAELALLPGCALLFLLSFPPGTYTGDLACTAVIVAPDNASETMEYEVSTTMGIDENRDFTIDGVEVALGEEVTRSLPNADLTFAITRIVRAGPLLQIEYAPRPTLPGITVDGELVETYRWVDGAIQAAAVTDLTIEDVDGTTTLAAECDGTLESQ
jgi:hypothetical protein